MNKELELKLSELKQGNTIEVYDKNLISYIREELNEVLLVEQSESCFKVKVATDQELNKAYLKFCKVNNFAANSGKVLNNYIKEVKVIWV